MSRVAVVIHKINICLVEFCPEISRERVIKPLKAPGKIAARKHTFKSTTDIYFRDIFLVKYQKWLSESLIFQFERLISEPMRHKFCICEDMGTRLLNPPVHMFKLFLTSQKSKKILIIQVLGSHHASYCREPMRNVSTATCHQIINIDNNKILGARFKRICCSNGALIEREDGQLVLEKERNEVIDEQDECIIFQGLFRLWVGLWTPELGIGQCYAYFCKQDASGLLLWMEGCVIDFSQYGDIWCKSS